MHLLGIDLGGTKLALCLFTGDGDVAWEKTIALNGRQGAEVGALITSETSNILQHQQQLGVAVHSIGICVPGIVDHRNNTIWAPNIAGWDAYPLLQEIQMAAGSIPVVIDSDRACYIMGEVWKGCAQECTDAIFMAVGTGIGAGILVNGEVMRGAHDISGAIGWMSLQRPYAKKFEQCGCFESRASGSGMVRLAHELLLDRPGYTGILRQKEPDQLTTAHIFDAYAQNDPLAKEVIDDCVELWGMAVANLVSLFDPEKIILGGGVFGPATSLIPAIGAEAAKWAQPVSIRKVKLEPSALGARAGLFGAGLMALKNIKRG